ncbi:hypothetical protein B0G81_6820 [Paraburkholderia sp. BL6665CI2N2]|uniref:hypothetical protein n=1 Tax=Paraburkholderia sp. BL6665CI2N2 TaxID=1938806 RepID=UPI0010647E23|nr:hypothetical protein [Paraburkholderia sp. BL6665CI2N2]TDY26310.1 hypothetical protein B0G81_6820 [Paraburkholderia sp. BL6665CI2N2]
MEDKRNLTDEDVAAIAKQIEDGILQRFQLNVGRGVLAIAWKWILTGLVLLAAYGAGGGFKKWGA